MPAHDRRAIVLSRYLALAWCGLIVYGSLHPFTGWRDNGVLPLAFLEGGWPRYWTAFDLLANIAVYLPLGFFLTLALRPVPGRLSAPILAVLIAGGVSLGLETVQNWLPSRVPSNLDLACNTLGGLLGTLAAQLNGQRIFAKLADIEQRLVAPVPHVELGITLLGLWLLIPLSPETLLFGAGDLRELLGFTPPLPFSVDRFAHIEAGIAACHALAIGLILRQIVARIWMAYLLVPIYLALGLAIRALGTAILVGPDEAMIWLTPGARLGLLGAAAMLALTLWLPTRAGLVLAASALLAGTILVNLAPANPYSAAALAAWKQGHFLNFNGLTRLVASLWPFLCLPFLILSQRRP